MPLDRPILLILDTNVVSRIEEIAKRGLDRERVSHRKVVRLASWLSARRESVVISAFGVVEGAGFHSGQLSPAGLLSRSAAVDGVLRWASWNVDAFADGRPVPMEAYRPSGAANPADALDLIEELLPLTVLAGYVTALAVARATQLSMTPVERARWLHRRLVADLGFIPLFGWFAGVLALCGRAALANRLRTSFFKLGAADLRRACLSAAWDLGYLQLMSLLRTPQVAPAFACRPPVLVTEERQLPELAASIAAHGDGPEHAIATDDLHPRWREETKHLLADCAFERALVEPRMPTWDTTRVAAERLERELQLDEAPLLRLFAPTRSVEARREDLAPFLLAVREAEAGAALERFAAPSQGDVLLGGIVYAAGRAHDNARARNRAVVETWAAVVRHLPDGAMELSSTNKAVLLARASDDGDWIRFNAALERMEIDGDRGFVLLWLWRIVRDLLADTARARESTIDTLLNTLAERLMSDPPAEAPSAQTASHET